MLEGQVPERETTLEQASEGFEEGGVLGGLGGLAKGLGQMLTPRAGLPGQRGIGDVFREFVEFSPLGDIGDVAAAIDPNSGLDPLERIVAALPVFSVGAVGARTAYKAHQRRHTQTLATRHTQPSMLPGPNQSYDLDGTWEQPGVELTPEQRRAQDARFAQMALEKRSPFSRNILRSEDWNELGYAFDADAGAMREIGAAVVAHSDPALYGQDPETQQFVAAKISAAKWVRAKELGLVTLDVDLSKPDGRLKVAQLETATAGIVGPDLTMPTPGRLAQVVFDEKTGEPQVYYAIVDGLLPTERVFDWDTMLPYDEKVVRQRQQQIDYEAIESIAASNIAKAFEMAPEQAKADPESWYRQFNQSSRALAEATGFSVHQVAGVLSAMSAQAPWLPHNLVGGIHVVLQAAGLQPGTQAYVDTFKQATVGSGWKWDMFDESGAELRTEYGPTPETGMEPDFEGLADYYADPGNVTSEEGRLPATNEDKVEKIDLILKGNVPPWMVLRMMKTNTFGRLGAEPSLQDLVVTDTWNDRLFWGTFWTGVPLAFDGRTEGRLEPGETYFDPVTGESVDGSEMLERVEGMREHGWTDEQVDRYRRLLAVFPNEVAQARFLAQARAHLLVRDMLGLDTGHAVQAPSWATARYWNGLGQRLENAKTLEEVRQIGREGLLDSILLTHLEGNPALEKTAAGMVWDVSDRLDGRLPLVKDLKAAKSGANRPASSNVKTGIIATVGPDGKVVPYADPTVEGVAETLRHATPSGLKVGDWVRYIANKPKRVLSTQDHFEAITKYRREDGRLAAGHAHATFDPGSPGHPAMLPGDRAVLVVPKDHVSKVEGILQTEYPFEFRTALTRSQRLGAARNQVAASDIQDLTDDQLGQVLQDNDWIAITGYVDGSSNNWDAHRRLALDIKRRGGEIIEGTGNWEGATGPVSEPTYFVTGLTYKDAFELGKKYGQESVATRHAMIYMPNDEHPNGYYQPVREKPSFGDSVDERNHTALDTGQRFSFDYDWVSSMPLPEDIDSLADQLPQGEPMQEVTVELGGDYGGPDWRTTDRLLNKLAQIPGARMRLYTHSPNRVPAGFEKANQSVWTDRDGMQGSVVYRGGDELARHQAPVYVPRHEYLTLSEDGFGAEKIRRSEVDTEGIVDINQEAGEVRFDLDLIVRFDPEANVTIAEKGPVFRSLKVDGKLVREVVVDTTGEIPVIEVSDGALPQPGRTVVQLSRGKAMKIMPHAEGDWAGARDALASVGLTSETVDVEFPQALEDVPADFQPGLELSMEDNDAPIHQSIATLDTDLETQAQVRELIGQPRFRVRLGKNAGPEMHRGIRNVMNELHGGQLATSRLDPFFDPDMAHVDDLIEGTSDYGDGPAIKDVGVQTPIELQWSEKLGRPYVSDGNHRLAAAKKLGLSHVPVRATGKDAHLVRQWLGPEPRLPGAKLLGPIPPSIWEGSGGFTSVFIKDAPDADALTLADSNTIVLNERQMVTRWNLNAPVPAEGYFVRSGEKVTDFEATVIHETGHVIYNRAVSNVRDSGAGIGNRPGMAPLVSETIDRLGGYTAARQELSRYAVKSNEEFAAEAFIKVMVEGEGAHPALVDFVKEMINRAA